MITINNLVKKYGKFTAVDDINLQINKGSIFGFIGHNGAGKSTTMKIMSGLLTATSGEVIIDEINVIQNPHKLCEKIGYMPDFFGVYDNLKVKEYLDFYAGTYYIPYKERGELIGNMLELVDLSGKEEVYVDVLSRGMKQRLCLARALLHDPSVLILDEPASGLDPLSRIEMKEILRQLKLLGKTIIISSHILTELAELCTDVAIFNHGKIAINGNVNEILQKATQGRELLIKPIDKINELINTLKENINVKNITENAEDVNFSFTGNNEELSQLIKQIVLKDIPIINIGEKGNNLENIFMEVTQSKKIDQNIDVEKKVEIND